MTLVDYSVDFGIREEIVGKERQCGGCTLCCKLLGVAELSKPPGKWCKHCEVGKGCRIYGDPDRPEVCRGWYCGWRLLPFLGDDWYPAKSKIVVDVVEMENHFVLVFYPERTWREWHDRLHHLARIGEESFPIFVVLISDGGEWWIVLPNGQVKYRGKGEPDNEIEM
jgi:hypothetical protein